jgi:hypothetical protein
VTARAWTHLHLPRFAAGDNECISVKHGRGPVFYVDSITLEDAEFRVSEAGRQRCLSERVRNVHAWVVGDPASEAGSIPPGARKAVYDPFKGSTFVDAQTLTPVLSASKVWMNGKNVYYIGGSE